MPSCAIVTCQHRSDSTNFHTDGITFHRFPSNPEIKEKWITATARGPVWWPVKGSTICSVHFKENQFRPLPKSRRLFDWAVPTLKLPHIPTAGSRTHDFVSKSDNNDMEVLRKPFEVFLPISPMTTDSDTKIGIKSSTVTCELQNMTMVSSTNDFVSETDNIDIKPPEFILPTSLPITTESDTKIGIISSTVTCELQNMNMGKDMECGKLDETPSKMRIQIERYKSMIQQKNRKIRTLQKKTCRYRKRIDALTAILKKRDVTRQ